jgi:hypothetical protein
MAIREFSERRGRTGLVTNQPPGRPIDWDRAHASTIVCDREECQAKAKQYVAAFTNETAVYYADADRGI